MRNGLLLTLLFTVSNANAVVWDGRDVSFTRGNFVDWTLPEHQDRITDDVWLTRKTRAALFNIAQESGSTGGISPVGTRWAFEGLKGNPVGAEFSAANHEALLFDDFVDALNGRVGDNVVGPKGVLHILSDDIYIDIAFSQWELGPAGGGTESGRFSYIRSSNPASQPQNRTVPISISALSILFGLLSAVGIRRIA